MLLQHTLDLGATPCAILAQGPDGSPVIVYNLSYVGSDIFFVRSRSRLLCSPCHTMPCSGRSSRSSSLACGTSAPSSCASSSPQWQR